MRHLQTTNMLVKVEVPGMIKKGTNTHINLTVPAYMKYKKRNKCPLGNFSSP